jgi:HSP20 family molecular chaperone IbpA
VFAARQQTASSGTNMIATFADPFDALLSLQRALEAQLSSDWLHDTTTSRGTFPPINVFQQGEDLLAIIELPGIDKNDLLICSDSWPPGRRETGPVPPLAGILSSRLL